jgi:hypothetical protein
MNKQQTKSSQKKVKAELLEALNRKPKPAKERLQEILTKIPDIECIKALSRGAMVEPENILREMNERLQCAAGDFCRDNPRLTPPPLLTGNPENDILNTQRWAIGTLQSIPRPPLGDIAAMIHGKLKTLPEDAGMKGPEIANWLATDKKILIDETTLRKNHLSQLEPYGLYHKPRIGYCLR